jgi:hypothetical protein
MRDLVAIVVAVGWHVVAAIEEGDYTQDGENLISGEN